MIDRSTFNVDDPHESYEPTPCVPGKHGTLCVVAVMHFTINVGQCSYIIASVHVHDNIFNKPQSLIDTQAIININNKRPETMSVNNE